MARPPKAKAVPATASTSQAPAGAPGASGVEPAVRDTASTAPGGDQADTSTSASADAARSPEPAASAPGGAAPALQDAASNVSTDTPSEQHTPAAAPEAAAGSDAPRPAFTFEQIDPADVGYRTQMLLAEGEPERLFGFRPTIEIFEGHLERRQVVELAQAFSDLNDEDWAAQSDDLRTRAVELTVEPLRHLARASFEVRQLFARPAEGLVAVTAKSRDGKPYRRAGVEWTGDFQTQHLDPRLAARVVADTNLVKR